MEFPSDIWAIIKDKLFLRLFHYCDGSICAYDARDNDTYLRMLEQDKDMAYAQYADMMLEQDWPPYYPRGLDFPDNNIEIDEWIHGIPVYDLTL